MIKIMNLTVHFAEHTVLDNISCVIPKKQITCIIGKSGVGKSVLMKTVLGLIPYQQGAIEIDHLLCDWQKPQEFQKIKKKMTMLFQSSALFDSMSVFQNIAFPLYEKRTMKFPTIEEKVHRIISLANLSPQILSLYPADLSGGMRKRVALARAIIQEPEYLIYDEPTTGLDPITGEEIINLIGSVHRQLGMTSIVITHDLECIKSLSNQLILLHAAKIIFHDDYQNFKNAEHEVAKDFVRHIQHF